MTSEVSMHRDGTFKTSIGGGYTPRDDSTELDQHSLKLPNLVNFVALRETFLSEAPFVNRSNRAFWKKWIDCEQYTNILIASINFISSCIEDNGSFNVTKMNNIHNNSLIRKISINLASMMVMDSTSLKKTSHDILFRRLPELVSYMLINALHSSAPKHIRLYNSVRFREIILDWLTEIIGGIRLTNSKNDRNWLFADAHEVPISLANNLPTLYKGLDDDTDDNSNDDKTDDEDEKKKEEENKIHNLSQATSKFSLGNSPLVDIYMNIGRNSLDSKFVCSHTAKVEMSHSYTRPLFTIKTDNVVKPGTFREKIITSAEYLSKVNEAKMMSKTIMQDFVEQKRMITVDLRRNKEAHKVEMDVLHKKPVTNRQLIAAATNTRGTKFRAPSTL